MNSPYYQHWSFTVLGSKTCFYVTGVTLSEEVSVCLTLCVRECVFVFCWLPESPQPCTQKKMSHLSFPKWRENGSWECWRPGHDGSWSVGGGALVIHNRMTKIVAALICCSTKEEWLRANGLKHFHLFPISSTFSDVFWKWDHKCVCSSSLSAMQQAAASIAFTALVLMRPGCMLSERK